LRETMREELRLCGSTSSGIRTTRQNSNNHELAKTGQDPEVKDARKRTFQTSEMGQTSVSLSGELRNFRTLARQPEADIQTSAP
jgi:hypothetical protein